MATIKIYSTDYETYFKIDSRWIGQEIVYHISVLIAAKKLRDKLLKTIHCMIQWLTKR